VSAGSASASSKPSLQVERIAGDRVPASIKLKGSIDGAYRWSDANGVNYLFASNTFSEQGDEQEGDATRSAFLSIVHAACQGDQCRVLRQLKDSVENCGEDITLDFDPKTVTLTDLDGNGYSEVAFAYRLSCKGDIGPNAFKLMLLENGQKYAIRGSEKVVYDGKTIGGDMQPDAAFSKAPPAFLDHAKALWKKFRKTTKY
jgi:hypothetical protein